MKKSLNLLVFLVCIPICYSQKDTIYFYDDNSGSSSIKKENSSEKKRKISEFEISGTTYFHTDGQMKRDRIILDSVSINAIDQKGTILESIFSDENGAFKVHLNTMSLPLKLVASKDSLQNDTLIVKKIPPINAPSNFTLVKVLPKAKNVKLQGTVSSVNKTLADVKIYVHNDETGEVHQFITQDNGTFTDYYDPHTPYTLKAYKEGFELSCYKFITRESSKITYSLVESILMKERHGSTANIPEVKEMFLRNHNCKKIKTDRPDD